MKTVLTIAGSDCSGGAGIQADIKTITAHKLYAMSVITALTAQNTIKVEAVQGVKKDFVAQQLECVFSDIFPDAIKIGMVFQEDTIDVIVEKLKEYKPKNIIIDPVMISTSGSKLLDQKAIKSMVEELMPLADLVTPNIPEAEVLTGSSIKSKEDIKKAALQIGQQLRTNVLLKGGHLEKTADDLLFINNECIWITQERIENPNTHGTGCTLSSAIASNLAMGYSMEESVRNAKKYLTGALKDMLDLGHGSGPLNHSFSCNEFF